MTACIIRGRPRRGYTTREEATLARGGLADVLAPGICFATYRCGRCDRYHVGYANVADLAGSSRWNKRRRRHWLARLVYQLAWRYELHVVDLLDEHEPSGGAMSWVEGRRVMFVPLQPSGPEPSQPGLVLVDVIDDDFVVAVPIDPTPSPPVLIDDDGQRLDGPAELDRWVATLERDCLAAVDDDDIARWLNNGPR